MLAHVRANLWLLALTVLLCSVIYPLALWGVGQAAFPEHANGSLIHDANGHAIASRLIAHEVKGAQYFQPRPSAASYNGTASGASNYGANNPRLRERVARSVEQWRDANPAVRLHDVPADLVTTSGSGLDPHITLDGALYQLPGVAAKWADLTGADPARLRDEIKTLVEAHARPPMWGLAGVPLVNVVDINLELHARYSGEVKASRAP